MKKGFWVLRGTNPPLYTAKAADIIKDKETGKEYIRGKMILFEESEAPVTVESTKKYEFIYVRGNKNKIAAFSTEEALTGLYVNDLLKK